MRLIEQKTYYVRKGVPSSLTFPPESGRLPQGDPNIFIDLFFLFVHATIIHKTLPTNENTPENRH